MEGAPYREASVPVHACTQCGGLWVGAASFHALVNAAAALATDGEQAPRAPTDFGAKVVYRNCPTCGYAMLRKNFGRVSGIIVDVCKRHGVFLDPDELDRVLAFVRGGGLAEAQAYEQNEDANEQMARSLRVQGSSHGLLAGFLNAPVRVRIIDTGD